MTDTEIKVEKKVAVPSKSDSGVASDSDDDLPIITLIKKREREEKAYREAAERERKASKPSAKSESSAKPKSSSETKKSESSGGGGGGGGGFTFYETTDKGRLIHAFLIRWWYAYDWPTPEEIGKPPAGFESLDGFPGVFVSTRVSLSKIKCDCLMFVIV